MGSSIRNMQNAKNRIIAINIAREGIEAMRNIRDTNWLKFQSRRRACWNHLPTKDPSIACTGVNPIEPGDYLIYKQGDPGNGTTTYRWRLSKKTWGGGLPQDPNLTTCDVVSFNQVILGTDGFMYQCIQDIKDPTKYLWINTAQINLIDADPNVDSDLDNNKVNDKDLYNHLFVEDGDALGVMVDDYPFRRILRIEYMENNGDIVTKPVWDSMGQIARSNLNRMRITSLVSWQSGRLTFDVELVTHLTDYLGREKLGG